ncbi:thiamine phosphate synthase [Vibrio sp. E150_011]
MKILLPVSNPFIKGHIETVLCLAKVAGFDSDTVELGTSLTSDIQLVSGGYRTTVSSDVLASSPSSCVDYTLLYEHKMGKVTVYEMLNRARPGCVYLNVKHPVGILDAWSCNSESIRALSADNVIEDTAFHLAWFAVSLLLDFPLEDALVLARAGSVSRETWPHQHQHFPVPVIEDKELGIQVGWAVKACETEFPHLDKMDLGLYPVVDSVEWIAKLLPLGIKTIQLRIKDPACSTLESQIKKAIELGQQYDAQVFINDYWQLALKHNAFGVHLGQEDIEVADLNRIAKSGARLGLSTHGYYELLRIVQISPSYIALGHIFPTTTKDMPSRPQGLIRLGLYQQLIDTICYADTVGYPTVAIGGIDLETAAPVWNCGVSSLAVVRAITLAQDISGAIDKFSLIMRKRSHVG